MLLVRFIKQTFFVVLRCRYKLCGGYEKSSRVGKKIKEKIIPILRRYGVKSASIFDSFAKGKRGKTVILIFWLNLREKKFARPCRIEDRLSL